MTGPLDLVIAGAEVVTERGVETLDIGIADGRIAALGQGLDAPERVAARGLVALPGGVDSHCHIDQRHSDALDPGDDFASGTASALAGGTTTVVPHVWAAPGVSIRRAAEGYLALGRGARCDWSAHLTITDTAPERLAELPALVAEGFRSIKLFMTYEGARLDDAQLIEAMAAARALGALVCLHCENDALIGWLTRRLADAGLTRPLHHAWSRPVVAEREATHRALALAEALDCPVIVFHVSHAEVADEIARARARGVTVFAETCPQYLTLGAPDLDRPGVEGWKFMFSPAPRAPEAATGLWDAIRAGTLEVISSDHSPTRLEDPRGKLVAGRDAPFWAIPNGIPGLAARLPLVWHEGVAAGRINLSLMADLVARRPAQIFGLYPGKGAIRLGADADLCLIDPAGETLMTNAGQHHGLDFTPYEGRRLQGRIVATWAGGRLAFDGVAVLAPPGRGRFLPRAPYDAIATAGHPGPFDPVAGRIVG